MDTMSTDWKMQYSVCVMCSIGFTTGLLQQSQLLFIIVTVTKEFFSFLDNTEVLEIMFIKTEKISVRNILPEILQFKIQVQEADYSSIDQWLT
jgi:hypothetical protein